MFNRAKMLHQLEPGLRGLFNKDYNRYPTEYTEIFDTYSSERAYEEELGLVGLGPAVVKPEGAPLTYDDGGEGFIARYLHETVALGFQITEEAIDDNLYENTAKRLTRALAFSMHHTKEVKGASILNNAFSSAYVGGDGKALVATDHPLWNGDTYSNRGSADLSETALEDAYFRITDWKDDRGLPIAMRSKKLVIPPSLTFVAERLLGSTDRAGTSDNDVNALRTTGIYSKNYTVNHYLTDPDAWFLITSDPDGLKHFRRKALTNAMEGDFESGNVRYSAKERYSFGWSSPRAVFASPGA